MLKSRTLLDIFIILLLSFTPFLWLQGKFVVAGHDAGLPLDPTVHFVDRLHTWTFRYGEGSDQSFALAGFFIHGFEAFLDQFGLSLSLQQSLQFSVYFFLMGLSMYVFSRVIFEKEPVYFPLLAAVVYQYNHFILQAWFIAERTKFSLYIALPLFLTLLFLVVTKKKSPVKYGILGALLLFVLNGGGFLPLYGAFFVASLAFSAGMLFFSQSFVKTCVAMLTFFGTVIVATLFLQAYWLLPYLQFVRSNFAESVAQSGGVEGVIHWLKSISEHTSYINLLRLQGIQEWYVNPEHPYAAAYTSFLLTTLSFIIPGIFIFALKQKSPTKKHILVLIFVALFSLFFMAGSHAPFGWIYIQMIKYIPGFIAFRTPFYKFSPGLYIAIAPLLAYVCSILIARSRFLSRHAFLVSLIAVGMILSYNFPFFTRNFFQYTEKLSNKLVIPGYVYEYGAYANSPEYDFNRTLLVPGKIFDTGVTQYEWGYWSLASLHSLLDVNAYITPPQVTQTLKDKLVLEIYTDLLAGGDVWPAIASSLHIDSILVQEDFIGFDYAGNPVDAAQMRAVIENTPEITLEKEFGKWSLYRLPKPQLVSNSYITVAQAAESQLIGDYLFSHLELPTNTRIFTEKLPESAVYKNLGAVVVPECEDCYLLREQVFFANQNVVITPGSSLYEISQVLKGPKQGTQFLAQDPIESLQNLYVIRTHFDRKDEYASRSVSWEKYVASLEVYSQRLSEFIAAYEPSVGNNATLQGYYANLLTQKTLLNNLALFINQAEEAEHYRNSFVTLTKALKDIEGKVAISRSYHVKEYTADLPNSNEYSLDVYLPSTNYTVTPKKPIEFTLNGTAHSVSEYSTNGKWLNLGVFPFSAGNMTIVFSDAPAEIVVDSQNLQYSQDTSCQQLSLGKLSKDRYQLSVITAEEFSDIDFSIYITEANTAEVSLPYWGLGLEKQSLPGKYVVLFDALANKEYELSICDTKYLDIPPITVKEVVIDRVAVPVLALSAVTAPQPSSASAGLATTVKKNTVITSTWPDSQSGFITTAIPYSANWIASSRTELFPDALGFITTVFDDSTSSDRSSLRLSYEPEKYFIYGTIISIISGILALVIVVFFL